MMTPLPTVAQALARAQASSLDRLDAQLLLLHALGQTDAGRGWLLAHDTDALPIAAQAAYDALCARRAVGEPLAYLTGRREFFGLNLQVDARVLDPRPDTETLVEWALALPLPADAQVIDLGTGSGAIALALASQRPGWRVSALDASADALAVARDNAAQLGLIVLFSRGHWLVDVSSHYHCIVANPPYIAEHDTHLPALHHEPRQALVAGPDGLADLRTIVSTAGGHLHPGGWLLVEHGYDQATAVRGLFDLAGFVGVASRRDLAGHERCTGGRVIGDSTRLLVK